MNSLLQHNPFRTLGLFANAKASDIELAAMRLRSRLSIGVQSTLSSDLNQLLPAMERTPESVTEAEHALATEDQRVRYAQFWFIKQTGIDGIAISHLMSGNIDSALAVWEGHEDFSALHNAALTAILKGDKSMALDKAQRLYLEHEDEFLQAVAPEANATECRLLNDFTKELDNMPATCPESAAPPVDETPAFTTPAFTTPTFTAPTDSSSQQRPQDIAPQVVPQEENTSEKMNDVDDEQQPAIYLRTTSVYKSLKQLLDNFKNEEDALLYHYTREGVMRFMHRLTDRVWKLDSCLRNKHDYNEWKDIYDELASTVMKKVLDEVSAIVKQSDSLHVKQSGLSRLRAATYFSEQLSIISHNLTPEVKNKIIEGCETVNRIYDLCQQESQHQDADKQAEATVTPKSPAAEKTVKKNDNSSTGCFVIALIFLAFMVFRKCESQKEQEEIKAQEELQDILDQYYKGDGSVLLDTIVMPDPDYEYQDLGNDKKVHYNSTDLQSRARNMADQAFNPDDYYPEFATYYDDESNSYIDVEYDPETESYYDDDGNIYDPDELDW